MITLPTRDGYMVSWYTGETKTLKYKNGKTKEVRMKDSYTSTSRAMVEAKAKWLRDNGYEIEYVAECIF